MTSPLDPPLQEIDLESNDSPKPLPNNNAQVVALLEHMADLQKANRFLWRYIVALLAVSTILGVSQIATAIVAARLSKDTTVDSSTGQLVVNNHDHTPVVVVGTGTTTVFNLLDKDDKPKKRNLATQNKRTACVRLDDLEILLTETVQGTRTNVVVQNGNSMTSVSFQSITSNMTHTCLLSNQGGPSTCTLYEPCSEAELSGGRRRRNLVAQGLGRNLTRQRVQRHLLDLIGPGGGGGDGGDNPMGPESNNCCAIVELPLGDLDIL